MLYAMGRWRRTPEPARLPPEGLGRAVISGVRYVFHSSPIRVVIIRTLLTGVAGASVTALTPLVARDVLGGTAQTYGLLLGRAEARARDAEQQFAERWPALDRRLRG